jgi:hypothetical protein
MVDPKEFREIPLNTFEQTKCSPPEPDPSWRGIAIRGPRRVGFKRGVRVAEARAFAVIPICGLYRLDVLFPVGEDAIELFAEDRRTGRVYSGTVVETDSSPAEPHPGRPPLRKEDVEGMATGRYFNPNLADFVRLPAEPAIYDVHVEIRDTRSNVVMVEIIEGEIE